jgi:hypothetical protein
VGGHGFDLFRGVVIGAVIWHKKNRVVLHKLLILRQIAASLIATEAGVKRFGISSDILCRNTLSFSALRLLCFAVTRPVERIWLQGIC